jgi:hypothetical protein
LVAASRTEPLPGEVGSPTDYTFEQTTLPGGFFVSGKQVTLDPRGSSILLFLLRFPTRFKERVVQRFFHWVCAAGTEKTIRPGTHIFSVILILDYLMRITIIAIQVAKQAGITVFIYAKDQKFVRGWKNEHVLILLAPSKPTFCG